MSHSGLHHTKSSKIWMDICGGNSMVAAPYPHSQHIWLSIFLYLFRVEMWELFLVAQCKLVCLGSWVKHCTKSLAETSPILIDICRGNSMVAALYPHPEHIKVVNYF